MRHAAFQLGEARPGGIVQRGLPFDDPRGGFALLVGKREAPRRFVKLRRRAIVQQQREDKLELDSFRQPIEQGLDALRLRGGPCAARPEVRQQAGLAHEPPAVRAAGAAEHFFQLFADAFGGDALQPVGHEAHRGERLRLDFETEARGETRGAQDAQVIFFKALRGVADGADEPGGQVALAVDVVDDLAAGGVEEHPVDREIAALRIAARVAEVDVHRPPAVFVRSIGAKRGDLHPRVSPLDQHHSERRADEPRWAKEILNARRRGIGGHVVIFRWLAAQQVAYATAGEQRVMAGGAERLDDFESRGGGGRQFARKGRDFRHGGHHTLRRRGRGGAIWWPSLAASGAARCLARRAGRLC